MRHFSKSLAPGRVAVYFARQEAVERGAPAIDTEHLLLGVLRSDPGLARAIAAQAGYEEGALLRRLDQLSPRQPKPDPEPVEMPLTERSSRVLSVAGKQLSPELAAADLLVALIGVDGVASQVLREFGVTEAMVLERPSGGSSGARHETAWFALLLYPFRNELVSGAARAS